MSSLFIQMFILLLLSALIGLVIGWLFSSKCDEDLLEEQS
jgi:predicted lysophospholipase L1 biosynthesis ABC-type transport system permease subunit